MIFVGFDLHKRYITACALDASGAVITEIRQLSTAWPRVLAWLSALPAPVTVAMEATLYWEWLVTQLQEARYAVEVAGRIRCGHHPWLYARPVTELSVE